MAHDTSEKHASETAEDMSAWTPAEVDSKIAELLYQKYMLQDRLTQHRMHIDSIKKSLDPTGRFFRQWDVRHNEAALAKQEEAVKTLRIEIADLTEAMQPYEDEYLRRGGWTRAFVVTNSNGHVHSSMECSTCRDTTRYAWLTEYSGKTEDEVVGDAGERACTVCYPTAPVEVRNSPTRIFTPDERDAQAKRLEREEKRAAKAAAAEAKKITAPDGTPLMLIGYRDRPEPVRSEREAQSEYVILVAKARRVAEGALSAEYFDTPRDRQNAATLREALQRKKQMTDAEFDSFIEPKVKAKVRDFQR